MNWSVIRNILAGNLLQTTPTADKQIIGHLLTDSRLLKEASATLFFAIKGKQNGHDFIESLYQKGVRFFIVSDDLVLDNMPEATVLKVTDSLTALQAIATAHRSANPLQVVGITGSNGKTTIKEWLTKMVAQQSHVIKTPKSYNSQIGVPLSVWNIAPHHEVGIFEAGISKPDEMSQLAKIIQPTFGMFTNIGPAHDEGFTNRRQKIEEKARLFSDCQQIICCRDQSEVFTILTELYPGKILDWSLTDPEATCYISKNSQELTFAFKGKNYVFNLPFDFDIWVENCIHSILAALLLNINLAPIQTALDQLRPVKMRLSIIRGIRNCYLIDDTYNNDLLGLEVALDYQKRQQQYSSKTLILSELVDAGLKEEALYQKVAALTKTAKIDRVILIGENIARYKSLFVHQSLTFTDTEDFLSHLPVFGQEMILIKGARRYKFERIVQRLAEKSHQTRLEINFEALIHNLNQYRALLKPTTKVMGMVKAFGYGGGSAEIANLLQFHNIDYLGVAYTDEAMVLRQHGIHVPIMVMSPEPGSFDLLAEAGIEPEVYHLTALNALIQLEEPPAIHLKIETGMNRLGFEKSDWQQVADILADNPQIKVAGIFTHLSSADDPDADDFSLQQIRLFEEANALISSSLGYQPLRHAVNSVGLVRFPAFHFDMVRVGIGLYGYDPSHTLKLREISKLTTYVSQVKKVGPGQAIGYGRSGKVTRETTIATVPVGYADGYDRRHGNGVSSMSWHGKMLPTIGNVCMDMTMLDANGLPVKEGDPVEVFGDYLSLQSLAANIGTIPYEIIASISQRVVRVYLSE